MMNVRLDRNQGGQNHVLNYTPLPGQLIRTLRSRKLFITTLTELKAMAALAKTGLSISPVKGYKTPAAMGMPITL